VSRLTEFLKTTLFGGLLFLVPVVLVGLVLRHALQLASKVAKPIAAYFPYHQVAGIAVGTIFAALMLVVIAFLAGLAARTNTGRRLTGWVEQSFLGNMPQYRVVTSMAEGLAKIENSEGLVPVMVSTDGSWQLGYALEELGGGWTAVFIPQSPTPMSGNVLFVSAAKIRPLGIGIHEAMKLVKHMGMGSAEALKGVDFAPSREA
jgi:uncharacterized membrane protein